YMGVDVGEKTTFWLHVVAHGRPGHGSRPIAASPPNRLVRALDRILAYHTPFRVLRVVAEFLRDMAPYEPPQRKREFGNIQTALFDAIGQVSRHYFPGTPVVPHITSGYTENQRYRPLGINAYGFSPYAATDEEGHTEHGNDERIRVEELRRGPRILFDVVAAV